jgi:hypothetical protein
MARRAGSQCSRSRTLGSSLTAWSVSQSGPPSAEKVPHDVDAHSRTVNPRSQAKLTEVEGTAGRSTKENVLVAS